MATRPSAPLLKLILEAARKKGWNTSTLANAAGVDRSRLKQVLAGREPLTVDEMILISNAMELAPADLVGDLLVREELHERDVVLEAEAGVEVLARGDPGVAVDADPEIIAGDQVGTDQRITEFALQRGEQAFAGFVGLDDRLFGFFDGGFSR